MKYVRRILPLIGLVLFYHILTKLSWSKLWLACNHQDWWKFAFAAFSAVLGICIKSIRWVGLLECSRTQEKQARQIFFASIFYGMVSPGRIGEFIKIEYLKDLGFSYQKGLFYTICDRFFDVFILVKFSVIALCMLDLLPIWILILMLPVTSICMRLHKCFIERYGKNSMSWRKYFSLLGITLVSYFVYALGFPILLGVDNLSASLKSILSVFAGNLIALVPISINGLGTREALYFFLLDWIPRETLLIASLSHFFTAFFGTIIFCSLFLGTGIRNDYFLKKATNLTTQKL